MDIIIIVVFCIGMMCCAYKALRVDKTLKQSMRTIIYMATLIGLYCVCDIYTYIDLPFV